ncbi:MAG: hypothetical protein V4519_00925 [Patescibacteria group bacterium]
MSLLPRLSFLIVMILGLTIGCAPHNEGERLMKEAQEKAMTNPIKESGPEVRTKEFSVAVDRTLSSHEYIERGTYVEVNPRIPRTISDTTRASAEETMVMFSFERSMRTNDILKIIVDNDCRPANLVELLAFGAKYPEFQNDHIVLALGEMVFDKTNTSPPHVGYNPVLMKISNKRVLQLAPNYFMTGGQDLRVPWENTCFAAVRNTSK